MVRSAFLEIVLSSGSVLTDRCSCVSVIMTLLATVSLFLSIMFEILRSREEIRASVFERLYRLPVCLDGLAEGRILVGLSGEHLGRLGSLAV